jgi:hypothetical protein
MNRNSTAETILGSVQNLTDGLLHALAHRTGKRDPGVTAAWRTLEEVVSRADVVARHDASVEDDERYDEVRAAARAVLAVVPVPRELDRRSPRRDTRPQSPRALRAAMCNDVGGEAMK